MDSDQYDSTLQDSFQEEIRQRSGLSLNLAQEFIGTTEDKLRLCLIEHLARIEQKHAWIAPVSLCITFITVLLTAEFKNRIFEASTWEAVFVILALLTFILSIRAVYRAAHAQTSLDMVVKEIKQKSRKAE